MDIFYKVPKHKDIITKMFLECKKKAIRVHLEVKNDSYSRVPEKDLSFLLMLKLFEQSEMHWYFIKRFTEKHLSHVDDYEIYYEVGGCTLGREYDSFMFIYLTEEIGDKIVKKYKLNK